MNIKKTKRRARRRGCEADRRPSITESRTRWKSPRRSAAGLRAGDARSGDRRDSVSRSWRRESREPNTSCVSRLNGQLRRASRMLETANETTTTTSADRVARFSTCWRRKGLSTTYTVRGTDNPRRAWRDRPRVIPDRDRRITIGRTTAGPGARVVVYRLTIAANSSTRSRSIRRSRPVGARVIGGDHPGHRSLKEGPCLVHARPTK